MFELSSTQYYFVILGPIKKATSFVVSQVSKLPLHAKSIFFCLFFKRNRLHILFLSQ